MDLIKYNFRLIIQQIGKTIVMEVNEGDYSNKPVRTDQNPNNFKLSIALDNSSTYQILIVS